MLTTLNLKDFVIIEQLSLDLTAGFTVLTGETGAGKSILIDALQLVRGGRGDAGLVRKGAERASIAAEFSLPEAARSWLLENELIDERAESVLVRRTIDRTGRSRAWVNGIAVTLTQLRDLGDTLVDIQGQHAHQLLLKPACQMKFLDAFAEDAPELEAVRQAFDAWSAREKHLREATAGAEIRQARIEQLEWILEDLDALAPVPGEWARLTEEHARLAHAASIEEGLHEAIEWLTQGEDAAADLIGRAQVHLESLSQYEKRLPGVCETLSTAAELIADAAGDLENILDRTDVDGERFAKVDRRVSKYFNLARKHRTEPENLPAFREDCRRRLTELRRDENIAQLEAEEAKFRRAYDEAATLLSKKRLAAAGRFAREVTGRMQDLAMKGGSFGVRLEPSGRTSAGAERCEFLMAGHPGVERCPLAKVASGGELSRISLAIFTLAARSTTVPTLVFDEVDSGIGGGTGEIVGRMLLELGATRQVLCITHLPQVAACGTRHLKVEKLSDGIGTTSYLRPLAGEARADEIARMLGGVLITKKARELARELMRIPTECPAAPAD